MEKEEFTIDDFIQLIDEHWPNMRNSEKAISGIRREFRHLIDKELKELWIFIKDKADLIKNPSVTSIKKAAKDTRYRIRKSNANVYKVLMVCGQCDYENENEEIYCLNCGKHLSDLPKVCPCGYEYKDPTRKELESMWKLKTREILFEVPLKCGKCGRPRQHGTIKKVMV